MPNASDPQHFNRYTYVGNSPISKTDPTGHITTGECGGDEGCSATQNDIDKAIGNAAYLEKAKFYRDCANGGGSGCPNAGELIAFGVSGMALSAIGTIPEVMSAGYAGVVGYTTGNSVANLGNSKSTGKPVDLLEGWNLRDAALSYMFSGVTGGIIRPGLTSVIKDATKAFWARTAASGLMGGTQYSAQQLLSGGKPDGGMFLAQVGLSSFGSAFAETTIGLSHQDFSSQVARSSISSGTKNAVIGLTTAVSTLIANNVIPWGLRLSLPVPTR